MKVKIGNLTKIRTGKLDANASSEDGQYPFFTCSREPLKISTYSYDCECVLVAGNGDLNVKYYNGKFDAYQRTYIIEDNGSGKLFMPYLYYFMEGYIEELRKQAIGGVIKYIKLGNLTDALIELPSIDEQKAIVDILEKAKNVLDMRNEEIRKLENLIKARFVEMFGSIHESTEYPYVAVKDLTDVISGGTPSREKTEYWAGGTIPWVKTTELQNNIIIDVDEYITEAGLAGSSAKLVPAGTVLVAMYGQGKTRGMTAYLDIEASTNQACACILPSDKIDSMFLWKYFELSYDKLRSLAQGAGQPNLNGNMIKNFQVLVPPIGMQKEYVDFVRQVDKSKVVHFYERHQTEPICLQTCLYCELPGIIYLKIVVLNFNLYIKKQGYKRIEVKKCLKKTMLLKQCDEMVAMQHFSN